jgi:two-component system invasion response regulator UvrY
MPDLSMNHHGPVGVLVVDDQEIFRKTLRDLVTQTDGLTLAGEATSGEEAIAAVERLAPGMVIMDVRMPGIGGVEAARQLTEDDRDLFVVLVSVEPGDPELVRRSGAATFLRKQELSPRVLREALELRSARR